MDRCIAINLRGDNEGQQCERKASKHGYCTSHLRSKHVKAELAARGIDPSQPVSKPSIATPQPDLFDVKPASISKPTPKPVPKPPRLSKTQQDEQKDKAFAASFLSHAQAKLDSGDDVTAVDLYDHSDILPEEDNENPPPETVAKIIKKSSSPPSQSSAPPSPEKEIDVDPDISYERRLSAVNFVKRMSNLGVFVVSGIAENTTPLMNGYTRTLMSSPEYNVILDEAAEAYADYLGVSDMSPEYKLILLSGMVAAQVIAVNKGLMDQHVVAPVPKDYRPTDQPPTPEESSFIPAYSE